MSRSLLRLLPALLATTFASLTSLADPASAETGRYYVENPDANVRRGWNFGVGLGGGEISCSGPGCDDVTEAGSLHLQVGHMLRPRLRTVLDIWAMAHSEETFTVHQSIVTAGLQYWIVNRLWLRGGIGFARAGFQYDGELGDSEDESQTVIGVAGGIGFELLSRRTYALDLELRGGTGFYDSIRAHNGAFAISFTWY